MTTERTRINSLTTCFSVFYCFAHFRIKNGNSLKKTDERFSQKQCEIPEQSYLRAATVEEWSLFYSDAKFRPCAANILLAW